MRDAEAELLAEGEALLSRREELERAIMQRHRGSAAALRVRAAQAGRQRERVRVELRRITEEADEAGSRGSDEDDEDPGYEREVNEGFYEARERLAQADRELVETIAALERRAAQLRKESVPAALTDLVGRREQVEAELRRWRGRCRRLGLALSLPRFDEYAGAAMDD